MPQIYHTSPTSQYTNSDNSKYYELLSEKVHPKHQQLGNSLSAHLDSFTIIPNGDRARLIGLKHTKGRPKLRDGRPRNDLCNWPIFKKFKPRKNVIAEDQDFVTAQDIKELLGQIKTPAGRGIQAYNRRGSGDIPIDKQFPKQRLRSSTGSKPMLTKKWISILSM